MAMESLFVGAEKVRAKKHANTFSRNVHRQCAARIASQMWDEEKRNFKAA
ncbi:hypothetical protein EV06_0816 [Prochlorococcus sp. MIT 0602]|nr:hypothetical protein EV06_0816 [Prochlorococcus sp. MIT 0602]KGG17228.1 hypothetical protein EV07_0664 [Prochlorococcus sp. MIT 0603]